MWVNGVWVQRNKEERTTEDEPISRAQGQSEENYTPFPPLLYLIDSCARFFEVTVIELRVPSGHAAKFTGSTCSQGKAIPFVSRSVPRGWS